MANTTFSGPVRSENGFQWVTKDSEGTITVSNALGNKFDFTGMTHTATATGASISIAANVVATVNYTGGAACAVALPAATPGVRVAYVQRIDTHGGSNTLTFNADGDDAWVTGSYIETRSTGVSYDISTAGEGQLVYTCGGSVTTNFFTIGSILYFSCTEKALWHIGLDSSKDPLALTGTFAFAA